MSGLDQGFSNYESRPQNVNLRLRNKSAWQIRFFVNFTIKLKVELQ